MARPEMVRSLHSTTTRRLAPSAVRGSRVTTKSPFLERRTSPEALAVRSRTWSVPRRACARRSSTRSSKSMPLAAERARSAARAAPAASMAARRSLSCSKPRADLRAELVQRRAQPCGVQQLREARGVPVEVGAQQDAHAPDGRVAALLVEELAGERAQLAAVPEEGFQRSRQPAVAVREVGPQDLVHLAGDPLVERLGLAHHGLELVAHDVHVQRWRRRPGAPAARCAGRAPRGPTSVSLRPAGEVGRQARVDDGEATR